MVSWAVSAGLCKGHGTEPSTLTEMCPLLLRCSGEGAVSPRSRHLPSRQSRPHARAAAAGNALEEGWLGKGAE